MKRPKLINAEMRPGQPSDHAPTKASAVDEPRPTSGRPMISRGHDAQESSPHRRQ